MNTLHGRRSTRLQAYDYAQAGAYFVTICARACLFGEISNNTMQTNQLGQIVEECWAAIPSHFPDVELDVFCLMPNHFHGIIVISVGATHASPLQRPGPSSRSLGAIVGSFKSAATKRIRELKNMPNLVIWQRNYYEHVIRNDSDLDRIRTYIVNNPFQWANDENNPVVKVNQ